MWVARFQLQENGKKPSLSLPAFRENEHNHVGAGRYSTSTTALQAGIYLIFAA